MVDCDIETLGVVEEESVAEREALKVLLGVSVGDTEVVGDVL